MSNMSNNIKWWKFCGDGNVLYFVYLFLSTKTSTLLKVGCLAAETNSPIDIRQSLWRSVTRLENALASYLLIPQG